MYLWLEMWQSENIYITYRHQIKITSICISSNIISICCKLVTLVAIVYETGLFKKGTGIASVTINLFSVSKAYSEHFIQ